MTSQANSREFCNLIKSHILQHQSPGLHTKSKEHVKELRQERLKLEAKNARAGMKYGRPKVSLQNHLSWKTILRAVLVERMVEQYVILITVESRVLRGKVFGTPNPVA